MSDTSKDRAPAKADASNDGEATAAAGGGDPGSPAGGKPAEAASPGAAGGGSVARGDTHADEPYVGVDPVYMNHANDTEAPLSGDGDEGGVFDEAVERERATRLEDAIGPSLDEPPSQDDETAARDRAERERARDARRARARKILDGLK